jgi:hypothetical protein
MNKPTKTAPTKCARCGGSGIWAQWWENGAPKGGGTCFRCYGNGVDPKEKAWVFPADWTEAQKDEFLARKFEQAEARAQRASAKREAEREAKRLAALANAPQESPESESPQVEVEIQTEWFDVLLDVDTLEWIPAKVIETRYGLSWAFLDENGQFTGQFVSAFPKRASTINNKGYAEGEGRFPTAIGRHGAYKTVADTTPPLEIRAASVTPSR